MKQDHFPFYKVSLWNGTVLFSPGDNIALFLGAVLMHIFTGFSQHFVFFFPKVSLMLHQNSLIIFLKRYASRTLWPSATEDLLV